MMKGTASRTILRRQFIRTAGIATVSALLAACGVRAPEISPTPAPTETQTANPTATQTKTPPPTITPTFPPTGTPTTTDTPTPTKTPTPEYTPVTTYSTDFDKFFANPKESFVPMTDDLAYNLARTSDYLSKTGVLTPFPETGRNPLRIKRPYPTMVEIDYDCSYHKDYVYPKFGIYVHSEYKGIPVILATFRVGRYDDKAKFIDEQSITTMWNSLSLETKVSIDDYINGITGPIIITQTNNCTDAYPSITFACNYKLYQNQPDYNPDLLDPVADKLPVPDTAQHVIWTIETMEIY